MARYDRSLCLRPRERFLAAAKPRRIALLSQVEEAGRMISASCARIVKKIYMHIELQCFQRFRSALRINVPNQEFAAE